MDEIDFGEEINETMKFILRTDGLKLKEAIRICEGTLRYLKSALHYVQATVIAKDAVEQLNQHLDKTNPLHHKQDGNPRLCPANNE